MKKLLLIDFDFTLFDTTKYWQDFGRALAKASGKPDTAYADGYEQFVSGEGKLRFVDYEKVLDRAAVTHEQIAFELKQATNGKDYLYADGRQLLADVAALPDYEVQILTFGEDRFQKFKLDLAPEVAKYHHNVIQRLKTDFIAASFPGRQGVLIDDKPDQQLPSGWIEIHINRKAESTHTPKQLTAHIWQITSLTDAISLL